MLYIPVERCLNLWPWQDFGLRSHKKPHCPFCSLQNMGRSICHIQINCNAVFFNTMLGPAAMAGAEVLQTGRNHLLLSVYRSICGIQLLLRDTAWCLLWKWAIANDAHWGLSPPSCKKKKSPSVQHQICGALNHLLEYIVMLFSLQNCARDFHPVHCTIAASRRLIQEPSPMLICLHTFWCTAIIWARHLLPESNNRFHFSW